MVGCGLCNASGRLLQVNLHRAPHTKAWHARLTDLRMTNDNDLADRTRQLLIVHAHRFDGYAWANTQAGGNAGGPEYLAERLYKPFQNSRRIPTDPAAALALNYYLHRNFYHWGYLPGPRQVEWMEMIFLYLHTYRLPTPKVFRHQSAKEWEKRPQGAAEAAAAEIRSLMMRWLRP